MKFISYVLLKEYRKAKVFSIMWLNGRSRVYSVVIINTKTHVVSYIEDNVTMEISESVMDFFGSGNYSDTGVVT